MMALYRQFRQGGAVAICAAMSTATLSYIILDCYKIEKKQITSNYEKKIKILNNEIEKLKLEKTPK
jgi:hypothetical protein